MNKYDFKIICVFILSLFIILFIILGLFFVYYAFILLGINTSFGLESLRISLRSVSYLLVGLLFVVLGFLAIIVILYDDSYI